MTEEIDAMINEDALGEKWIKSKRLFVVVCIFLTLGLLSVFFYIVLFQGKI